VLWGVPGHQLRGAIVRFNDDDHDPEDDDVIHPYDELLSRPIQIQWHELFQPTSTLEFENHFSCAGKGIDLHFVMSPGKMIYAVLSENRPYSEF